MALTQQFNKPDFVNAVETDLSAIRDNFWFCLLAAVNGSVVIPGWSVSMTSNSSPLDYSEPDAMTLTYTDTTVSPQVVYQFVINYTWTDGNVTGMVIKFDDGTSSPSLATVTGGTITISYDSDGNFTGATSA